MSYFPSDIPYMSEKELLENRLKIPKIKPYLKPCPFCGCKPTIRTYQGKNGWRDSYAVLCRYDEGGCGAESGLYHYEDEAIEAWNRRVTE